MNRLRFYCLYAIALFKRYSKALLLISALILLVGILGYYFVSAQKNKVLSEGFIGTYTEKDLVKVEVFNNLLSEGLVKLDESGLPQPNLVLGWEANKEANKYTFKLKDNLYWADGSVIKSSDIDLLIPGAEINTPDDKTIEFKLIDSFSPLPSLLTVPIFKRGTLVGTGPYVMNKTYFSTRDNVFVAKVELRPTKNDLPFLHVRFYPNERIAKSALKVGEVQSLLGITELEEMEEQPWKIYSKSDFSKLVTIFYNLKDPILSDENFRLALSYGAPSIAGEETAITSIPPNSWAFNKEVKDYLDNPEQAKISLNKVKNGRDSTISLTTIPSLSDVGERVVNEWKKQGVKAALRIESGVPQNFQALLITYDLPNDPTDQYSLWHSTQVQTNLSKLAGEKASPRIDKDLEDARKTTDLELRKARYADFQRVLLDNAPATFLYFPKYNVVMLKKVEADLQKILDLQLN